MELVFSSKSGAKLWLNRTKDSQEFLSDNPEEIQKALLEDVHSVNPVDRDWAFNFLVAICFYGGIRHFE